MAGSPGDLPLRPGEMRDRNRALVLDAVVRSEPVTRAQLAARTGLTKSSVSSRAPSARGTWAGPAPRSPWPATAWPGWGW